MKDEEPVRWLSLFAACIVGSVALATDERDFGGDESQSLRLGGFALPKHKTGRQTTSRCSPPVELQRKVSHYLQPILSHRFLNNLA